MSLKAPGGDVDLGRGAPPDGGEREPLTAARQSRAAGVMEGSKVRQYVAACAANLGALACGTSLGWSSSGLSKLLDPTLTPLGRAITLEEQSWVGSLVALGAGIGPFPAGAAVGRIGRRGTILVSMSAFIVAWFMTVTTCNVVQIYASRFLIGIGIGAVFTALPMYIAEIAEDSVRGSLGSLMQLFITAGLFSSYLYGPYLSFFWLGIVCLTIPILCVLVLLFFPESPYFLVAGGKTAEARDALYRVRGLVGDAATKEIEVLEATHVAATQETARFSDVFSTAVNRRALLLSLGLVTGQQLSGSIVIVFYTEDIFDATGSSVPSTYSAMAIGAVLFLSSFVTPGVVEKSGRRMLLFVSGLGMALCLAALGIYFWLKNSGHDISSLSYLPVVSLVLFQFTYCLGFGPLPWPIMAELFPPAVKAAASSSTASFCWLLGFVLAKFFGDVALSLGMAGAFFIFAGCCVAMTVFVYFLLPETKGKSLEEIQEVLRRRVG